MIIENMAQGSEAWFEARLAIVTASNFSNIITSTGKKSTQRDGYMNKLLAEWLMGQKMETKSNDWMTRGTELEPDARSLYEFETDCNVLEAGIIFRDQKRLVACSPDGLIEGKPKGLEIKCPAPHTHVSYLLKGKIPATYVPQVQGSMYVTGFDSWDFLSYHPDMEPLLITVDRNEEYIKTMDKLISEFVEEMLEKREKLKPTF